MTLLTTRVERLLRLVRALQSGKAMNVDDLAREAGTSRRTLFRDLELLERAGLAFEYDRTTKRYAAARSHFLPAISFNQDEAFAIILAARHLPNRNLLPNSEAAFSVEAKLESILPHELRNVGDLLSEHITIREISESHSERVAQVLPALQGALGQRKKVRLLYDSRYDQRIIETHVRPYHLAFLGKAWYLIGWCEELSRIRTFKLARIQELNVLDNTYRMDDRFSLDDYLGNAWSFIRGDQRYVVRVRFLPKAAANVGEFIWHRSQQTTMLNDGSLMYEVEVDGLTEILWWILGYGDQAHVIEPEELREMIRRHAENMLHYYRQRDGSQVHLNRAGA